MTRLEERVGDACREAAGTVRPEAVRSLDLELGRRAARTRRGARRRRSGRVAGPLAAAASIAVIAVGASVVVPRLVGGAPSHKAKTGHTSTSATSGLAALPTYTVLNNNTGLEVVVTATGQVAGHLRAPAGQAFAAIAGTASDRTFLVAADLNPQTSCRTFFYRFSLGTDGQPSALTRLPVRALPGLPTALAASANGRLAGYSVVGCATGTGRIGPGQAIGHIGLINLAVGKITRQWSYTLSEDYTTDLSMSDDGSLLGYSNFQNAKWVAGRVLAASSPPGPDLRYSHIVVRQPVSTALSTSGRLMYAMTGTHDHVLAAYDTANGRQAKVLHQWPAATSPGPLVADPAGRYALLPITTSYGHKSLVPFVKGHHYPCIVLRVHKKLMCERTKPSRTVFFSINLATGTVTKLPFRESGPAYWGMVAW